MTEQPQDSNEQNPLIKRRKPWLAGVASFFCFGLGHVYSGDLKKGILIFTIANLFLTIFSFLSFLYLPEALNVYIVILVLAASYIYIIVDSVRTARKKDNDYFLKSYNRWYVYILFLIAIYLYSEIKYSVISESYYIPTGSMEKTLIVGDHVWVNKLQYGIHLPFTTKYLFKYGSPHRGDIISYKGTADAYNQFAPEFLYVKRCVGTAGDTIEIINKILYVNGKISLKPNFAENDFVKRDKKFINTKIFPKGSNWNEDWYGPIVVPKKNDKVKINDTSFINWKIFMINEGHDVRITNAGKILVDDEELPNGEYTIEKDYIFILGDNRNNSLDSRFWGFIPTENVIGKVYLVTWSRDPNLPLLIAISEFGGIRWDRVGLKIE